MCRIVRTDCHSQSERHPIQCIIPPYMLERLARSADPKVRDQAIGGLSQSAAVRAVRAFAQNAPGLMAMPSPAATKYRLISDARKKDRLTGKLVRSEGE
jgi:hypothetical protein